MEIGRVDKPNIYVHKLTVRERKPLFFALKGVEAQNAKLLVDDRCLSSLPLSTTGDEERVPLYFLGEGVPLHAELLTGTVEIHVEQDNDSLPSIMVGEAPTLMESLPFSQRVTVQSDTGPREFELVYTEGTCGFQKIKSE